MPSGIPENTGVGWHVRAYDGAQWSPWSYEGSAHDCNIRYDTSAPAQPVITSTDYPASVTDDPGDPWYDGVGRYGAFTIASPQSDATTYWFGVNGDPTSGHAVTTTSGAAKSVSVMPAKSGVNFITAESFDAAGNQSGRAIYYFRVRAGQPERVRWGLDESAGSTSVSGQGGSWPAALTTGAKAGAEGVSGGGLRLDGTSGEAATVSPVLDTSKSFSVSIWAKLPGTDPGKPETVIAQSGNTTSSFEIYYSSALGGWVFERYLGDTSTSTSVVTAVQPACPAGDTACTSARVSQWTHLVGVFDYPNAALELYVDGHLAATTPYTATPWDARRSLHLGAHAINGTVGSYFDGTLDQVALFDYQLNDA
jgi:hypothetical protein